MSEEKEDAVGIVKTKQRAEGVIKRTITGTIRIITRAESRGC